ncbi:hypothetical protein [Terrisporobacter mayombei]|uniref:Tail fiber protein n=1 Tax=Terrisporobacter mayombei TaxID=1541 RepID=A0ABY9PYB5_9FIRM|nr:hypothetical protein [Terrisporobacter mayombei]MCC3868517.1 hypothetical protein [Terrisporobacter mayombei]WMT80673.1 hypothetical protein TEMA_09940 [Terrisporobacter mayombei]
MIEEGQEYTTPIYDEDGNLIEVIEDYDVFLEDETSEEEHDDAYYLGEEGDLAEEDYAEEDNVDPVESRILTASERYTIARDSVIERLTQILENGEITIEDNADLNEAMFEYTESVTDMKDKLNEVEHGNNDTNGINQGTVTTVLPEELQHLIDLMNNGGRNDLLFVDEEGRVLVEGEQVPKLKLVELEVDKLVANYAEINELVAKKASIEDLTAVKAQIGTLEADEIIADIIHSNIGEIKELTTSIGRIDTLIGGNLTMENIQSLILTSKKVTVEDAFIKDAMIDTVNANKINAGAINTNLVNIESADGSLALNGTLQQFKDENGKVRIQMGKDTQGNFTFGLFDETGIGTLINSSGITEKAIGDGLIVDKMVGDDANISGSKLDINSVVTEINDGTTTIKGSKVKLDTQNQTLDVAFNTMNNTVTEQGKTVSNHTTSISTMNGKIETLISDTEIIEEGEKVTVKDAYSQMNQKVGEFGVSLGNMESNFDGLETRVEEAETKLTIEGLKTIIGSTYTTSEDVEGQITGKGYATTSDVTQSVNNFKLQFKESGGYNELYNGDFRRGLDFWSPSAGIVVVPDTVCTENPIAVKMNGALTTNRQISQQLYSSTKPMNYTGNLIISLWGYLSGSGSSGTTNKYTGFQVTVYYTDGSVTYPGTQLKDDYDKWIKYSLVLNPSSGKKISHMVVSAICRDTTKVMYVTNIMLTKGELEVPYAPNSNEIFDGITTINKDGIKVEQSNYNGYTQIKADGFYLNNGTEDVIKCTSSGLVVKGVVNVTGGSISESALAGTMIDGKYVKPGTILANSINIGDFTNYCTTPTNYTTGAGNPAYSLSPSYNHVFISNNLTQLRGGEQFLVTGYVYAPPSNTSDTNYNLQFCWRDSAGTAILSSSVVKPVSPNAQIGLNDVLTIPPRPANAVYGNFKAYVGNSAFALTYSLPCIRLMTSGSLIVDGAIDGKTIHGSEIIGGEFRSETVNDDNSPIFKVTEFGQIVGATIDCIGLSVSGDLTANTLSVKSIDNSRYQEVFDGDYIINIKSGATDSEIFEDGATFSSFESAEAIIPSNLNGYELTFNMQSNITENVVLDSYNSGVINVNFNGYTLKGYFFGSRNSIRMNVYGNKSGSTGGTVRGKVMPNIGRYYSSYRYAMTFDSCSFFVYDMDVYKGNSTDYKDCGIVAITGSKGYIADVKFVNKPYYGLRCHGTAHVYSSSSSGTTEHYSFASVSGSLIMLNNTTQAGRSGQTTHLFKANNGQIFADGVTFDGADAGGTNDNNTTTEVTKTVTVKANYGDTYRKTVYNSWKQDGSVRQGNYGYGQCVGAWFFGTTLQNYLKKNVTKVVISINRNSGGTNASVTHTLKTHNYSSRPSGSPTYNGFSRNFSVAVGGTATITLTSAEIASLKSDNAKGFGIIPPSQTSAYYSVCSGSISVKVTYKE